MDKTKKILREWVIPFLIEIIVVLLLIKYVFFLVRVPTGSMLPTIQEGGWLFATRIHSVEGVERGDILVFYSDELNMTLIKRCIGLPGDHVVVESNGEVFINGTLLEEPYVVYVSHLPGEFWVPEGHYLFFGDNRYGSNDARLWDEPYIAGEEITGRAHFTLWPPSNFGFLE